MADKSSFLGVGWGFPPRFGGPGRGVEMVSAEEDIRQSLFILMRTAPGERVMQPDYGCPIRAMVFEVMDSSHVADMQDVIARAVRIFEPRVIVEQIAVDTSDWIDGTVRITLVYQIIATNTRHNLVFPLYQFEATSTGFVA
jgi:uncharacterized protein